MPGFLYSQVEERPSPSTNLEIINSLLDSSLNKFEDYISIIGIENYYFFQTDYSDETSSYIFSYLRRKLPAVKFTGTFEGIKDNVVKFSLKNSEIKTEYTGTQNLQVLKKNMLRKIKVQFNSEFISRDTLLYKFGFSKFFGDEFDFSYRNYVESGNYGFVKGVMPEQGFWDKFIIPISAVAVSAAAIILFFAIRSK
jgi:hypothetical protein